MNCEHCHQPTPSLVIHENEVWCRPCHLATKGTTFGQSSMIATDDIPGGLEIKHGICNENGSPKKYYSKSAIKQAAYNAGLFIVGDTPKVNHRLKEIEYARREKDH